MSSSSSMPSTMPTITQDEPLLRVEDLSIDFHTDEGPKRVVHGLNFDLRPGETLALVGESGSGKTATSLAILDLLPRSAVRHGSILLDNRDLVTCSDADMRRVRGSQIAMVFQEPMTALNPLYTAERLLGQAMQSHGKKVNKLEVRERSIDLLNKVRMPQPEKKLKRYPHELSGGQRQRLMIAMALAGSPKILIADEPTTALDATVQIEILSLLGSLRDDLGMAMLLVTHDLGVVAGLADRVMVMEGGRAVESSTVDSIFTAPNHDFTKSLLNSIPRLDSGENDRFRSIETPLIESTQPRSPVLSIQDLCVSYGRGTRTTNVIEDLSLSIAPGEVLGIVGESGSGKSTLARTIVGLAKARSGTVSVNGNLATEGRNGLARARAHTGLIFQDPASSLNPRRTIGYSVVEPMLRRRSGSRSDLRKQAEDLLESVNLPRSWVSRYPHELSGGQRQRIAIARVLSFSPELILADEPTAALDVSIQDKVITLLMELQAEKQFAMLFISHDLSVVSSLAHRVAVMKDGKIVEEGPTNRVLSAPSDSYTQALISSVLEPDPSVARARLLRVSKN